MGESRMELEMRIDGLDSEAVRRTAERALRGLDPEGTLRLDEASGIAHVVTSCQALEVEDALARAGLQGDRRHGLTCSAPAALAGSGRRCSVPALTCEETPCPEPGA